MKTIKILLIFLIVVSCAVFGLTKLKKTEQEDFSNFPTAQVEKGDFKVTIEEVGMIEAVNTKSIQSPFRGKINKIVDDGTYVEEGDIVVWLDTEEIQDRVDDRQSALLSSKQDLEARIQSLEMGIRNNTLDVESAKADLEFSKLKLAEVEDDLNTKKALLDAELISETDLKDARISYHGSQLSKDRDEYKYIRTEKNKDSDAKIKKAQMADVNVRIDRSEKDLEDAKERLEQAQIKAPASGLFLIAQRWSWHTSKREIIKAGDRVWRRMEIGQIPDLSQLIVRTQIGETNISQVKEGTIVEMDVDAIPGMKLIGKVDQLSNLAVQRFQSKGAGIVSGNVEFYDSKVFEVTILLETQDERLKPGMTVNVSYIIDHLKNVKYLPIKAVFDDQGKKYVYKPSGKGYDKIEVSTDKKNRTDVMINSDLPVNTTVFMKKPKAEEYKGKKEKS